MAIVIIPFTIASWFILPSHVYQTTIKRKIDWPGVASLTVALILFVFALSEGSSSGTSPPSMPDSSFMNFKTGWGSARVVAPLVLSVAMFAAFFAIERIVEDPPLPPRTWSNKNFAVLFFYGWSMYWFLFASELQIVKIFTVSIHLICGQKCD